MQKYVPLHLHTGLGSVLDGFSKPKDIIDRCKELGLPAVNVSDHGTCYSHVDMYEECQKSGIKCILGIEFYFAFEPAPLKINRHQTHGVSWAKNADGIKDLWKACSYSNEQEIFYYKPRLNLRNWTNPETKKQYYGLEHFCQNGNLQGMSGHVGSFLADSLVCDVFGDPTIRQSNIRKAYNNYKEKDPEFYKQFLKPNWMNSTCELALEMQDVYGKGNFWIELQNELFEDDLMPMRIHPILVDCLREVSNQTGIPRVASADPHYVRQNDADDQRAMLKINLRETDLSIENKISESDEVDILPFFSSNAFYIHTPEEMAAKFTREEMQESINIANQVGDYNLLKKPKVPKFNTPQFDCSAKYLQKYENLSDKYLMYLCIEAAKKLKPWENSGIKKEEYWKRITIEMDVYAKAGLSDYLLVVWDFLSFCDYRPADGSFDWQENLKSEGKIDRIYRGKGRGSVGGSLVCYFLNIHGVDSLKYDLLFSRFYNEARAGDMPDVDSDIEMQGRDKVVEYLEYKYGQNNVGQIITFGRIQGKSAIRDLFRIKGFTDFDVINDICNYIPDESKIIDEIQEVRDSGEEYGIVRWALDHNPELDKYYSDERYKPIFDQCLRIEGTPRNPGRHASGYVVSEEPLEEMFPMAWDSKSKKKIIAFGMNTVAKIGGIKLDLLGLTLIDKLKKCQDLVRERKNSKYTFDEVNLDDLPVWSQLHRGDTIGGFQIESNLGQIWSKKLKPSNIEQLSDLISIQRPGPLESGQAELYLSLIHI